MIIADASFLDLIPIVKQYGPLILVVAYLLWQGWQRELRMSARIESLENDYRDVLFPMVERCTDVIAQNTSMMERLEKAMDSRFECPMKTCQP